MTNQCSLTDKNCIPCQGGVPPLTAEEVGNLCPQVPDWKVDENHHLARSFQFNDFVTALAFVNEVGNVAESEGHHPNIHLTWGQVDISIWTHKIDGLSESDFILAAKIDQLKK